MPCDRNDLSDSEPWITMFAIGFWVVVIALSAVAYYLGWL